MTSERRLVAIRSTDLVGYSALTQQNEAFLPKMSWQCKTELSTSLTGFR